MMRRRRITQALRVRVHDAHKGLCHLCGLPVKFTPWHLDHITPLSMGGTDDESNMAPAHDTCHRDKTAAEAPVRAKTVRVRARHIGAKRSSGRSFPTNKDQPFKKKISGEVVPRLNAVGKPSTYDPAYKLKHKTKPAWQNPLPSSAALQTVKRPFYECPDCGRDISNSTHTAECPRNRRP